MFKSTKPDTIVPRTAAPETVNTACVEHMHAFCKRALGQDMPEVAAQALPQACKVVA